MKQIDNEKYGKLAGKARVSFGLKYYGHSKRMTIGVKWDDKQMSEKQLDNEQLTLLYQLVNEASKVLIGEAVKRDLVEDEVKVKYASKVKQP